MIVMLRQIEIREENYILLKPVGKAGDFFNDIVSEMLRILNQQQQTDSRVGPSNQSVADYNTPLEGSCRHE